MGGVPLTSLLVADDQEKLPTGQCRPRVPPSLVNLRGDAYLSLQKIISKGRVRAEENSPTDRNISAVGKTAVTISVKILAPF